MNRYCCLVLLSICALTGCKNSVIDRSLIFATDTSLGLEVSVNPTESAAPAKILIGYKRYEGVLDPVYHNLDAGGDAGAVAGRKVGDYYRKDAYSVLAKFTGTVSATAGGSSNTTLQTAAAAAPAAAGAPAVTGTSTPASPPANTNVLNATVQGNVTLSQWFATGKAAELLAANGGVPALSDNPGVAAATAAAVAANAGSKGATLLDSGETSPIAASIANQLSVALQDVASGTTPAPPDVKAQAAQVVSSLDASPLVAKVPTGFNPYAETPPATYARARGAAAAASGFGKVRTYWLELEQSIAALEAAQKKLLARQDVVYDGTTINSANAATEAPEVSDELAKERAQREQWLASIQKDAAVRGMFNVLTGSK